MSSSFTSSDQYHKEEPSQALLTKKDLLSPFVTPLSSVQKPMIGVELEKLPLDRQSLKPISMNGPHGIQSILHELIRKHGWLPEYENNVITNLRKDSHLISVEPGGQIELSSHQHEFIDHAMQCEKDHLEELSSLLSARNVVWCSWGVHPTSKCQNVDLLPKKRYEIMENAFSNTGKLGNWMMKMTSSIQVSIDYSSEDDAMNKLRIASLLTPIFIAMFSNSCVVREKLSGYKSYRAHIWQNTDPARCGIPEFYISKTSSFMDYVDYALNVPMMFIERDSRYIPMTHMRFIEYLNKGYNNFKASMTDWLTHLSLLFPEIRLKSYIEIRCIDRQSPSLTYSVPTFIKSLFYSKRSLHEINALLSFMDYKLLIAAMKDASKRGMGGKIGRHIIRELAKDVMIVAMAGVKELLKEKRMSIYEYNSMQILSEQILDKKKSPADEVIHELAKGTPLNVLIARSQLSA